jgi:LuxR family maltose regulon positive regulatory protein
MKEPFAVDPTHIADAAANSIEDRLISAKFAVPPPAPVNVVRPRLTRRLDGACDSSVIVITGPAGSGKTTLAAHWTRIGAAPGPVSWLTLDENDNTPTTFWSYVVRAVQACCPGCTLDLPGAEQGDTVDCATIMLLATALRAQPAPVTIVLDRAELVTNRCISTQLESLLRYAAPALRLLVVGRSAPLVPLYRYQLTGALTEIRAEDLALTLEETADIVASYDVQLSADEVAALYTATEGWVTAVSLHALALRTAPESPAVPHPAGRHAVAEFLRSEILDIQPMRVRGLLLRTSILDRVDPDLADRLTGRRDARGILDQLVRTNTFVQACDDDRYRYPAPFRDVLHDELTTRHPDLVRHLHCAAARWHAERGRYTDSIEHAVGIGAWDYAAQVAVSGLGVARLLTSPDADRYRSTFAGLPDAEATPAAQVLRPILALSAGDIPRARTAARTAAVTLRDVDTRTGPLMVALRATQVVLARYAGDAQTATTIAADVDALAGPLPPAAINEGDLRSLLLSNVGVATYWNGQLPVARSSLYQAAAATEPGAAYMVHDALAHLALLQLDDGTLDQAVAYARQSLAVADRAGIRARARVGAASVALAATALARNDLAALREHLARAAATTSARQDPPTATGVVLLRAGVAIGLRDGRRVLAAVDTARGKAQGWHPSTRVTDVIELLAASGYLMQGDSRAARRRLELVSDGPERRLVRAEIQAAEGDHAGARRALAALMRDDIRPCLLQATALSSGRLAFVDGDTTTAAWALREALEYGRPDQRRRPIIEAGEWVHQLLRRRPEIATGQDWLSLPHQPGDDGVAGALVVERLTDREIDVLGRLADALSTEDIADDLYLSINTVKTHLKSIYRKLGASGRSAAARRARELKLLPSRRGEPPAS